ncbi:MAG TPA: hypothetical protein VHN14_35175 [Kofleriaceae bacterium]|nr:hypothetical protein [Kofleriaceae bacterium]
MMKTIVLVALLAAAGCSKKGSDCDAAITKGMDNFAASIKANAPKTNAINPQMQENMLNVVGKLKGTLTQRCTEDKWPAEVVSCFPTVATMRDMQTCQAKLSSEQNAKLMAEIRQVMMSSMTGSRMPAGVAGHPSMLSGSGSPAAPPAGSDAPAGATTPPSAAPPPPAAAAPPPSAKAAPADGTTPPAHAGAAPAGSAAPAPSGW